MAVYYDYEYSDTSRGLAIGAIIAIALSLFFFFCIIPLIGCCLWRKRKQRLAARNKEAAQAYATMQAQRATQGTTGYPQTGGYGQTTSPPVNGYYAQPPPKEGQQAYQYGPQTAGVQQTV